MFKRSARLYDFLYSHKDYEAESRWVRDAVTARVPHARTMLDVACGTGKHLEQLSRYFACEGLDINQEFVDIATRRAGVPVHLGDMDSFDLGKRFDAVVCLFSSVGYSQDLSAAIASMARHVSPRGVLLVEPWFTPQQWSSGTVQVLDREADGTRVVRMAHSGVRGNIAIVEMHHLVGTTSGVEYFVEKHELRLSTFDEYEAFFRASGLTYELELPGPFGRGAIIGCRD